MVSLGIFSVVPLTEPCALMSTQPLKVRTRDFSWGKGGRCVWLTTYHPCSAERSRKSGALIYPEPLGPPRPVAGDLYFFTPYVPFMFPTNTLHVHEFLFSAVGIKYPSLLILPNFIAQISFVTSTDLKVYIMQPAVTSSLRLNYLPQHPVLKNLRSTLLP